MPRAEFSFDESDESDFSETDMSIRGRKGSTAFHQRSASRHRRPQFARETYLAPVQHTTRVHRSASTGGRRPRDRESPPTVVIVNEQAQRSNNANSNKPRRVQQRVQKDDSDEEEVRLSRRRATSGVSREASPYHRDYELVMGQRMLEKNDLHQDLEIWKHQQEIMRLERELRKTRTKSSPHREAVAVPPPPPEPVARESRLLRDEEEWYEEEISDRLHKLQRFERKNRAEEERRQAEHRWQLKRFEEAEKAAANQEELKAKLREEKLKEIQRQQEEDKERERLRHELEEQKLKEMQRQREEEERLKREIKEHKLKEMQKQREEEEEREKLRKEFLEEEARKQREAEEAKAKELAMKAAAVEEWKLEQERIAHKQKEEAEQKDKEFRTRLRVDFGYSEEEIEDILKKKDKQKEKTELEETKKTTWIKVHRKHLLPETLMAYNLPWDWDERDHNYIIIKRWITEEFQEELFSHTRRLREGKMLTQTSSSMTELKVNDRNRDKMYLVRKKSPGRRWGVFA